MKVPSAILRVLTIVTPPRGRNWISLVGVANQRRVSRVPRSFPISPASSIHRFTRILRDSQGFLGILGDSWGFLGILRLGNVDCPLHIRRGQKECNTNEKKKKKRRRRRKNENRDEEERRWIESGEGEKWVVSGRHSNNLCKCDNPFAYERYHVSPPPPSPPSPLSSSSFFSSLSFLFRFSFHLWACPP